MAKFMVDTQLPSVLATYLCHKGLDAIHTTYFQEGHLLQDAEIRDIATEENRIVVTKDKDFLEHFLLKGIPPKVLLLQFGNIKNNDLLEMFGLHLSEILLLFEEEAELVVFSRENVVSY